MSVQNKYQRLIDEAQSSGIDNLHVREENNVLYIDGDAPNGSVKDHLWDIYGQIDPDFRSADVVLNVNVSNMEAGAKARVSTESSNLNIRKGPGTDQPIIGKAAHQSQVTLISKTNDQWWLVRTDKGEEGYAYAQYLTVE